MTEQSGILVLLGGCFLIVLIITPLSQHFKIPRVSLFILSGMVLAQFADEKFNGDVNEWFDYISTVTLLIVGYLLGTKITTSYLKLYARSITLLTLSLTLVTFAIVSTGLFLVDLPLPLALILGVLAVATDPAATYDVIKESKINNRFTHLLQGIVALDDAAGLILFSLVIAILALFNGSSASSPLTALAWELGGAVLLGGFMGLLLVYLLGKKQARDNVFVESLGLLFLCGGTALYLDVSFLISAMVMGVVVVNRAIDSQEHLHDVEFVEQPLLILFFILAGASASLSQLWLVGEIVLFYVLLRVFGRLIATFWVPQTGMSLSLKPWLGLALLPQAGVAMGMALLASQYYPEYQDTLMSVTVAATIIFELIGPYFTYLGLKYSRMHS